MIWIFFLINFLHFAYGQYPHWLHKACGRVDATSFTPLVICGVSSSAQEIPWQVSIVNKELNQHWCGGTLNNNILHKYSMF